MKAVVTGASSGVGAAVARSLLAGGAEVWAVGRDKDRLAALAEAPVGQGGQVHVCPCDLADAWELEALGAQVSSGTDALGALDALIHAAGVLELGPIGDVEMDDQYRVNLRAPYELTRALLPALQAGDGVVVFINSTAGRSAKADAVAYSATKAGLAAVADGVRSESGLRVTTVFLGRTATPMQEQVHRSEGEPYDGDSLIQPEDVARVVAHVLSLPRTAQVADITLWPAHPKRSTS